MTKGSLEADYALLLARMTKFMENFYPEVEREAIVDHCAAGLDVIYDSLKIQSDIDSTGTLGQPVTIFYASLFT